MKKDAAKIVSEARPLYLEIERILNVCEKFERQTGLKMDEMLTFDIKKMRENSIFDESQEKALLRVCLAGNFSSGKSSFLNELLEEELLPVALKDTTKGATRIHYSTNRTFKKDHQPISYEKYCKDVQKDGNFEISMPVPFLRNLVISDVPGFDPPHSDKNDGAKKNATADEEVSRKEMDNADVLIWLCKMSEGTMTQKGCQFLENYKKGKKSVPPLYLVITHCDSIESEEQEERNRVANKLHKQLEKIGFKPESTFFFSRKKMMEKEGSSNEHKEFILDEQIRLKETIAEMAQKHHSLATRRINSKIKILEQTFMQSLYELSSQIQLHRKKWLREYLENNEELKKYPSIINKDRKGLCAAFDREKGILLDIIDKALAKVKFCYRFKEERFWGDRFWINANSRWKQEWSKQRLFVCSHIETIPTIYQKYFNLPQSIIDENQIPHKNRACNSDAPLFIFGIEVEDSPINKDWLGNKEYSGSLQKRVDNCNKAIRNAWKEKISSHLERRTLDFNNALDKAFEIKERETEKFENAFAEFSLLDNLA